MNSINRVKAFKQQLIGRNGVIIALFILLAYAIFQLSQVPKEMTVNVPPNISGTYTAQHGEIPKEVIYLFANEIFSLLNTCLSNCKTDYIKNTSKYKNLITPKQKNVIKNYVNENKVFLDGRTRTVRLVNGFGYNHKVVQPLSDDAWVVYLDIILEDFVSNKPIDRKIIRFPIRVVRYKTPKNLNPWQVALDGYQGDPKRLTQDEEQESNHENTY